MRTIKFRGKRIDNGKWVYGSLIIEPGDLVSFNSIYSDINNKGKSQYLIYPIDAKDGRAIEVIPETIGQYIGFKNHPPGKIERTEMYEGDIVRLYTYFDEEEPESNDSTVHKIEYRLDQDFPGFDLVPYGDWECNGISWALCDTECDGIEIIGNVTDNPELLKDKT